MRGLRKGLFTVFTFVKINTRRFFRDKTAIFFTILFPLIFLAIFGGIFGKSSGVSFKVAVINQSQTASAKQLVSQIQAQPKLFKVDSGVTAISTANEKMGRGELDATLVLPSDFGQTVVHGKNPSGAVTILYTQNNQTAAQTLASVMQSELTSLNGKYVSTETPFTVNPSQVNERSLSQFDYTFAGLLGFSIMGLGIFGPVNVFPELKKQGILRRLHTTPLRVWQYFLATMFSQALIGLITIAIMFIFAITVFHLKVVGNYFEIAIFVALCIMMILGIGLAIGGWAKNERQAAPLANLVTFPMMFMSGTFFPRFLMPVWLQHLTSYIPLTPVIDGVRLMATEGKSLAGIASQLGFVLAWMVVIYLIAFRSFRWE